MRRAHATQGATMIMVVLFTLLLLAGLLAASMRLGVSSRRSAVDNAQALVAQYAAESAVARAMVRVGEVQALLSRDRLGSPSDLTADDLKTYAQQYCGNSAWASATSPTNGQAVQRCLVTQATTLDNQFEILAKVVRASAYAAVLPPAEAVGAGTAAWWRGQLGTAVTVKNTELGFRYTIQPLRVEREGASTFRFYLKLASVSGQGNRGGATRVLAGTAVQGGEWYIKLSIKGFTDNVLFTNFHRSRGSNKPNVNFTTQTFNGPVHTNERFVFANGATASFKGKVTSAGCINLDTLPSNTGSCTQEPGAWVASSLQRPGAALAGLDMNRDIRTKVGALTAVNWNIKEDKDEPKFDADYRPMPTTAKDVRAAASDEGLLLTGNINTIELKAANANGDPPNNYNDRAQRWTPRPTHQFITVTPDSGPKLEYRYGADRVLQQKVNGDWVSIKTNFNGVVFSDKTIGNSASGAKVGGLSGPGRDGSGRPLPALAPFAQMTVAGQQDMYISGDLTMSETPLVCDATSADFAECKADANTRKNVLGLYVQGSEQKRADISVTWDAPNDLTIHAMTMTSTGEMAVDRFGEQKNGGARGRINLTGGLVENYYGAFGTFNPNRPLEPGTGYGRNFNYDWRYLDNPGFGPPSFPISPVWALADTRQDDDENVVVTDPDSRPPLYRLTWKQASAEDF